MSEQSAPPMSQPTAEHALLKEHAGNWTVACQLYMDPSQPPMEAVATEKHLSKNERVFEMFCTLPDGKEIRIMSTHYRRA